MQIPTIPNNPKLDSPSQEARMSRRPTGSAKQEEKQCCNESDEGCLNPKMQYKQHTTLLHAEGAVPHDDTCPDFKLANCLVVVHTHVLHFWSIWDLGSADNW